MGFMRLSVGRRRIQPGRKSWRIKEGIEASDAKKRASAWWIFKRGNL